jgi:GDPmannose 4,6-dehydratase
MFGEVHETPQTEKTPFHPRSAYGISKVAGFDLTRNYREAYNMHASSGILFNHESPRRGENFVTRKITRAVGRIGHGLQETLLLGNLDAKRDWGFAGDYVDAMWRMLQADEPGDFVVATGETHTVREFCERSFACAGITLAWEGEGVAETGRCTKTGKILVGVDPNYFRPAEVDFLLGDPSKAKKLLGWEPKVTFEGLVEMMTKADVDLAASEKNHGKRT